MDSGFRRTWFATVTATVLAGCSAASPSVKPQAEDWRLLSPLVAPGRHRIKVGLVYPGVAGYMDVYTWKLKDSIEVDVNANDDVVITVVGCEDRSRTPVSALEWPKIAFRVQPETATKSAGSQRVRSCDVESPAK